MKEKYLYPLTSFLCGTCVMGVEMSATRLLSPYFGSTNLIWTLIIVLIMLGLGAGSYLGGRLADRRQKAGVMYLCVAAGAAYIALVPLISRPVISGGMWLVELLGPKSGFLLAALASCAALFVPPILLLGMVSPYLAKLCVSDLAQTGVTLGRLQVFSTAGSILGSVLPAFVLIPAIGTKLSFVIFSIVLLFPCFVHFLNAKSRKGIIGCILIFIFCITGALGLDRSIAPGETEYETESEYQYLRVERVGSTRMLSTGLYTYVQSIRQGGDRAYGYLDAFAALPALVDGEPKALTIGYGGGVLSTMLEELYGKIDSRFVEIDPAMIRVARSYFSANPEDIVHVDDGRRYLQANSEKYDVIAVDAYQDTSIPLNLVTREFFRLCAARMTPGGMTAVNIAMAGEGTNALCRALGDTMREAFAYVTFIKIPGGSSGVFVGSAAPMAFEEALKRHEQDFALTDAVTTLLNNASDAPSGGGVMTDDRSNAELLQLEAYAATMY